MDDGPLEWVAVEKWLTTLMEGPGLGHLCRFKGAQRQADASIDYSAFATYPDTAALWRYTLSPA
jgi:hypothetical protein